MMECNIGDRLRELRTKKGVNQDIAAESCGISRIALARYETGARTPRAEMVSRLADYYGVTVDYLLGRDDPPAPLTHDLGHGETKTAPADMRAEAKQLLEGLNDEQYQAALTYIKFLQSQK